MAEIKLKGSITKVTRQNGKSVAQVSLIVPIEESQGIPLGDVLMTIFEVQERLPFGKVVKNKVIKGAKN